ncbi:hypothetical protein DM02DRAFT_697231 [Periconia macrospinosa]|uniref:Uncharacterized protein n=1 Tax=Periconia macrospinosa TaxID=97972 RepID=A0A2V1DZI2_9PLEO|nr:hypothetical protein DM02DRAFT_697231 [Periconia macrospinosa]
MESLLASLPAYQGEGLYTTSCLSDNGLPLFRLPLEVWAFWFILWFILWGVVIKLASVPKFIDSILVDLLENNTTNPPSLPETNTTNPTSLPETNTTNPTTLPETNITNPTTLPETNTTNPTTLPETNTTNPTTLPETNTTNTNESNASTQGDSALVDKLEREKRDLQMEIAQINTDQNNTPLLNKLRRDLREAERNLEHERTKSREAGETIKAQEEEIARLKKDCQEMKKDNEKLKNMNEILRKEHMATTDTKNAEELKKKLEEPRVTTRQHDDIVKAKNKEIQELNIKLTVQSNAIGRLEDEKNKLGTMHERVVKQLHAADHKQTTLIKQGQVDRENFERQTQEQKQTVQEMQSRLAHEANEKDQSEYKLEVALANSKALLDDEYAKRAKVKERVVELEEQKTRTRAELEAKLESEKRSREAAEYEKNKLTGEVKELSQSNRKHGGTDNALILFNQTFRSGWTLIPTSGVNLECALHAITLSYTHQAQPLTNVSGPTIEELREIVRSSEYQAQISAFRTEDDDENEQQGISNLRADQAALALRIWGKQRGLDLQLGLHVPNKSQTFVIKSDGNTGEKHIIWVHNNQTQKGSEKALNHYSGIKHNTEASQANQQLGADKAALEKQLDTPKNSAASEHTKSTLPPQHHSQDQAQYKYCVDCGYVRYLPSEAETFRKNHTDSIEPGKESNCKRFFLPAAFASSGSEAIPRTFDVKTGMRLKQYREYGEAQPPIIPDNPHASHPVLKDWNPKGYFCEFCQELMWEDPETHGPRTWDQFFADHVPACKNQAPKSRNRHPGHEGENYRPPIRQFNKYTGERIYKLAEKIPSSSSKHKTTSGPASRRAPTTGGNKPNPNLPVAPSGNAASSSNSGVKTENAGAFPAKNASTPNPPPVDAVPQILTSNNEGKAPVRDDTELTLASSNPVPEKAQPRDPPPVKEVKKSVDSFRMERTPDFDWAEDSPTLEPSKNEKTIPQSVSSTPKPNRVIEHNYQRVGPAPASASPKPVATSGMSQSRYADASPKPAATSGMSQSRYADADAGPIDTKYIPFRRWFCEKCGQDVTFPGKPQERFDHIRTHGEDEPNIYDQATGKLKEKTEDDASRRGGGKGSGPGSGSGKKGNYRGGYRGSGQKGKNNKFGLFDSYSANPSTVMKMAMMEMT